jgi:hypothetical protein
MSKHRYFDHLGREVDAQVATRRGLLRSGFSIRIAMNARDASRVVVTDLDRTASSGNRPGFRVSDSPINRQAVHDAHSAMVSDLENAWRGDGRKIKRTNAKGQSEGEFEAEDEDEMDDEDMPQGELEQMSSASDRRTVEQIAHDHRQNVEVILRDHAQWLSEQWRSK